jgi:predicted PurR-regulated permease PerM
MANEQTNRGRTEQYIGSVIIVALLIGAFYVLKPFLSAAMWAIVLTFSLWPVHRRLVRWLRGRRTLAALIITVIITLALVVPFVILGFNLASDISLLGSAAVKWAEEGSTEPPPWIEKIPFIGPQAKQYWKRVAFDAAALIRRLKEGPEEAQQPAAVPQPPTEAESKLMEAFGTIVAAVRYWLLKAVIAIGGGLTQIVLSILLAFFFLREVTIGDRLTDVVKRIGGKRGVHLLNVAAKTVRGVIYGIIGTALVQGIVAGVGFTIAGVPGPVFLGVLTFFLSPVPVGPPMVWIPASLWLFSQGSPGWGIFMLIWGTGVSSIDNVVKPWFISQGSELPFILIFLGVIGGALTFGFIGVFLGPVLLAVVYRIIEEWSSQPQIENA